MAFRHGNSLWKGWYLCCSIFSSILRKALNTPFPQIMITKHTHRNWQKFSWATIMPYWKLLFWKQLIICLKNYDKEYLAIRLTCWTFTIMFLKEIVNKWYFRQQLFLIQNTDWSPQSHHAYRISLSDMAKALGSTSSTSQRIIVMKVSLLLILILPRIQ